MCKPARKIKRLLWLQIYTPIKFVAFEMRNNYAHWLAPQPKILVIGLLFCRFFRVDRNCEKNLLRRRLVERKTIQKGKHFRLNKIGK